MPLKRDTLERSLKSAQERLSSWEKVLDERQVAEENRRKDAKWRSYNAACKTITDRIAAIEAVAARDAEVASRKAEAEPAAAE